MNKAELIEVLATEYDGNKAQAAKALKTVTDTITYSTARGEKVSITGFGSFEKIRRPSRMVRNPRTGERKRAKATAVPKFRAGSDLKAYVSGEKKPPRKTAKSGAGSAKKTASATNTATTAAAGTTAKKASGAKKATSTAKAPAKKATSAAKAPAKKATSTAKAPAKKTTSTAKKTTGTTAAKSTAKKGTGQRAGRR